MITKAAMMAHNDHALWLHLWALPSVEFCDKTHVLHKPVFTTLQKAGSSVIALCLCLSLWLCSFLEIKSQQQESVICSLLITEILGTKCFDWAGEGPAGNRFVAPVTRTTQQRSFWRLSQNLKNLPCWVLLLQTPASYNLKFKSDFTLAGYSLQLPHAVGRNYLSSAWAAPEWASESRRLRRAKLRLLRETRSSCWTRVKCSLVETLW